MNRNVPIFFLKFALSALLVYFFVAKVELRDLVRLVSDIGVPTFALAIVIGLASHIVNSYKWKILLPKQSFRKLLLFTLIGQWYSTVLPGQITGEAVKAYRFSGQGEERPKQIVSVFVDKITGLLGLVVLAIIGLAGSSLVMPYSFWIALFSSTVVLILVLVAGRIPVLVRGGELCVNKLFARWPRYQALLVSFLREYVVYTKSTVLLGVSVFYGALFQIGAMAIVALFGQALGITIGFWEYAWIFGIVSVLLFIPITVAGLGLREGAFVALLSLFAVLAPEALALSFAVFSIQLFYALIGGILEWYVLFRERRFQS